MFRYFVFYQEIGRCWSGTYTADVRGQVRNVRTGAGVEMCAEVREIIPGNARIWMLDSELEHRKKLQSRYHVFFRAIA